MAPDAALAECSADSGGTVTCTGSFASSPYNATASYNPTVTLTVKNLSADITPDSGAPGVSLTDLEGHGGNGSDGLSGGNGHNGDAGQNLTVNYTGGSTYEIHTSGGGRGILSTSRGGDGGDGGNSTDVTATGGNGGDGKAGGTVTVNSSGAIETHGTDGYGIVALSLGGDGGKGGKGTGASGKGGHGGDAASGGTVDVTSSSNITTYGESAAGIFAQSLGGDGGKGGNGAGGSGSGGHGGHAAGGGSVYVDNSGNITTNSTSTSAYGIYAQSTGGEGGEGGNGSGIVGSGGSGGGTAPGGLVDVSNSATITVKGHDAAGIYAQSIGGFGGKGGSGGGIVGFGTSGSVGGDGGIVTVANTGTIIVKQHDDFGIFAQSVGGGGGKGGSGDGIVGLGSSGNGGGSGKQVTVTNNGSSGYISTAGDDSIGIFAQSIGGGGGNGGSGSGIAGFGGSGSDTSPGGAVSVTNTEDITTTGKRATAIYAQSTGGGGGNGGMGAGLISFGGSAGGGGNGGAVSVSNSGDLTTAGKHAAGIFAESLGGGGGDGGNAYSGSVAVSLAMGGSGGSGGDGGTVKINDSLDLDTGATTDIKTTGNRSAGIFAESVGGGGGNGGLAIAASGGYAASATVTLGGSGGGGGIGNTVSVKERGKITTSGKKSDGIFAQSVGGGGGNGGGTVSGSASGGLSLGFAMGGSGGSGGNSSAVTVNARGSITTTGKLSQGIFAQSVGGGGGNGGFAVTVTGGGLAGSAALGGSGGSGGDGNTVDVTVKPVDDTNQTIKTSGHGADGIFAQSVGGGGGNGGFAISAAVGPGSASVSLGGSAGGGGNGKAVSVTNSDVVDTGGNKAAGIFAQSVGGGGGNGGFAISGSGGVISGTAAVGGSGGDGGYGEAVTVTNDGDITTDGKLSYGIFAQSVGGGGGNGGFALSGTVTISTEEIPAIGVAVSVGGSGGGGGIGKKVTVDNTGSIETSGKGAHAIFAQSVGGGGGVGGFAGSVSMEIGQGAAFGVSVGGKGGSGGDAGQVEVTSTGATIITNDDGAAGIFAQSVGGGGGDGGFGFSGAFGFSSETSVNVAVAVGGAGSGGGAGKDVSVTNSSAVTTYGKHAYGILAQSIGGGGGTGGLAVSGTLGLSETSGDVGVSVGGFGGDGGTSGDVTVTNSGAITTSGDKAVGILAQSIGGSGGDGGLSMAVQLTGATKSAASVGVSVGGGGGDGNTAGDVTVNNNSGGTITTSGLNAHGIEAQSIGGGGGNGGLSIVSQVGATTGTEEDQSKTLNVAVAVGGAGGNGNTGGAVDVTNKDNIDITGDGAFGIFAQSTGGGGGMGGGAVDAVGLVTDTSNDSSRAVQISVAIGGAGGNGNNGGDVTVENDGSIATHGAGDYGIFAESVGGGGGVGGQANNIALLLTDTCTFYVVCSSPDATKNNWQLGVTVGGDGGGASNGGKVKVTNTGSIETWGDTSDGIFAQSTGGGGGAGGNGILGSGGILPAPAELLLFPTQAVSQTHYLQVSVGGNGGSSGDGKAVTVDNSGSIITHGDDSNGIFAQSVGGGGGIGGTGVIGAFGILGIGGKGHAAGDGGTVDVTQSGSGNSITTYGTASDGIFAQSVGGGGGVAGNVDRGLAHGFGPIPSINVGIGLAFGQGGGDGGDGKAVTVKVQDAGTITTHGDNAVGIFAQSVGGGGGVLGELGNGIPYVQNWAVGSNGDDGSGGTVEVDLNGTIKTSGDSATGIFAQSAGGKNGIGANVSVTVADNSSVLTGEILSSEDGTTDVPLRGLGSAGIIAQSVGDDSNGNITITTGSGSVVRGGRSDNSDPAHAVTGIGIWLIDGNQNTVANHGTVSTVDGVSGGYAIYASGSSVKDYLKTEGFKDQTGGDDTIDNYGTVTGSFDLGAGINSFTNEDGATLNSGAYAHVGSTAGESNLLQNDGTLSPGGKGKVFTTEVQGNWTQSSTGHYAVDLDLLQTDANGAPIAGKTADRVNVTGSGTDGGTANLAGTVDLNILNPANAQPGDHSVIIVHADTGISANTATALSLNAPASAVVTYGLNYSDSQAIKLAFDVDFSPSGLGGNAGALGEHLNNMLSNLPRTSVSNPLTALAETLFGLQDLSALKQAYDQMTPTVYAQNAAETVFSNIGFDDALHSCHNQDGAYHFAREGTCYWLEMGQQRMSQVATSSTTGFGGTNVDMNTGVQWNVGGEWQAGMAFGYSQGATTTDVDAVSTSQIVQGGVVLKRRWGENALATSLSGGFGRYDVNRIVSLFHTQLAGTQDMAFVALHGRLTHTFEGSNWYVRPTFDAGITHYMIGGLKESGSTLIGASIAAQSQTLFTVEPSVEIGGEFKMGNGLRLRPYVQVGLMQFLGDAVPSVSSTLQGASSGVPAFTTSDTFDRTSLNATVGITAIGPGRMLASVNGTWRGSRHSQTYGGRLKISWPLK